MLVARCPRTQSPDAASTASGVTAASSDPISRGGTTARPATVVVRSHENRTVARPCSCRHMTPPITCVPPLPPGPRPPIASTRVSARSAAVALAGIVVVDFSAAMLARRSRSKSFRIEL